MNSPGTRYLSYGDAVVVVEAARARATAASMPNAAPPVPLTDCNEQIVASALAAPMASYDGVEQYPSMHEKAAVLIYALAKSQACIDGNKRVALILVSAFLRLNDRRFDVDQDALAAAILEAAESAPARRDEVREWLCAFIAANTRPA